MISEFPPEAYHLIESDPVFRADVLAWWKWRNKEEVSVREAFDSLSNIAEFMSVAYYRFRTAGFDRQKLPRKTAANDLYIATKMIGPGFKVHHGHSTWILAEKIGADFTIYHNVTIGEGRTGKTTIGDRVKVCTGAVIYGGVTIGNDVKIGPNAVVTFDVPPGRKVFATKSVIV